MYKIIVGAIFLSGCYGQGFAIDEDFTDYEVEMIEFAIDEWIQATDNATSAWVLTRDGFKTPRPFSFWGDWVGGPNIPVIYKVYKTDPGYNDLRFNTGSENIAGAALTGWRVAIIVDQLDTSDKVSYDDAFHAVMLHELGHFYGLSHSEEGIMNPVTNPIHNNCIDWHALNTFCSLHQDCGPNAQPSCN